MFPKNRLVRVGRTVAAWSAIGGFLWVTGHSPSKDISGLMDGLGAMVEIIIASLFFAAGLLLIAAGRVSEIAKLGVIPNRSLNLMKVGVVLFFAGLFQIILGTAVQPLGKIPLAWYRFSDALLIGTLLCFAIGLFLMGSACVLHSANVRARVGGILCCLAVLGGIGSTTYASRFPSDDDPFAIFEYFFLSAICCSVGLLIAYFGLKKEGRLRLQRT
jgi:hypothetical protein